MIKISDLEKRYYTEELEITALNKVSVEIEDGEFVALMGPSGCGKSTLLNILGFLDDPDSGQYIFNGLDVTHVKERKRAYLRQQNVGFLFQNFNLIDDLTVFENVELPLIYASWDYPARRKRVLDVLDKMHIDKRLKAYPQQLSGGEQQRVALARAVVGRPNLILADEPTANLDQVNGKEVMDLLKQMNGDGTTIIMVTHSESDAKYSDRMIQMTNNSTLAI
jgi:putative ABC transport system ATP-binding protein